MTDHDQVKKVVAAAGAAFGGNIDVLINVAGTVGKGGKIEEIEEDNWDFVFDVNCKGSFLFIKEVVPIMKQGGGGSIVNFSSKSGKTGSALMAPYSAAKAAIIGLTQALAFELAGDGIRVNCLCPGITEATGVWSNVSVDYVKNMNLPIEEVVKKFTAKVPVGRLARIDDVVNMNLLSGLRPRRLHDRTSHQHHRRPGDALTRQPFGNTHDVGWLSRADRKKPP